eukprot:998965_1
MCCRHIMLSNSQKVDLLSKQIRWSNNTREIPWSITTTPNVNHLYSVSEHYKDLKYNEHIVAAIFDSLDEYDTMMRNLNDQNTILNATRCDEDAPSIGTLHKLSDELYAIAYDTCQFNWDNRPVDILYSHLFGGDDPLLNMRGTEIQLKDDWRKDVRSLMLQYNLIPTCIRKLTLTEPSGSDGSIVFLGKCGDKFDEYECGTELTLTIPIDIDEFDGDSHMDSHSCAGAKIKYSHICCHLYGYEQTNDLKQDLLEIQKTGYHHSMILTHISELQKATPNEVISGTAQNSITNPFQIQRIINKYRAQHKRHESPHVSITKLKRE